MAVNQPQHHAKRGPRLYAARWARQRGPWLAVSLLLIAGGIFGAMHAASTAARNDRDRAREGFRASAAAIASTMARAVQHEEDLVVDARAYIASSPNASESAFQRWGSIMDAFARYPELEGSGEVILVTPARLAAFAERERADPAFAAGAGGPFQLVPPGSRPFYCLVALSIARKRATAASVPAGFDYCAQKGLRAALLATRDSGRNTFLPYRFGSTTALVIETPIYTGGFVPSTRAARRRALIGTFSVAVLPEQILEEALRSHPGMAVELRYHSDFAQLASHFGASAHGAQQTTIDLGYGWTMQASGGPPTMGTAGDPRAKTLMVSISAVSVLLGLLVFVLGTSRARALAMVREKTRELSHRARHDALTGLPNRALVLDRAERMLARSRRNPGIVPAALFVDVDHFKRVNDTFGHAAGDQLLRTVAERLQEVVREEDTVGRLGGDEFIVLMETTAGEGTPELMAARIIEVMRRAVTLEDGSPPFTATVSVGIAIGLRASAARLLRDADLALYTAKGAGKDRAALFEAGMPDVADSRTQLELDLEEATHGPSRSFL